MPDGVMGGAPVRQKMKRARQPADARGDNVYTASVSAARPARVMPHSDDVAIPLEDAENPVAAMIQSAKEKTMPQATGVT